MTHCLYSNHLASPLIVLLGLAATAAYAQTSAAAPAATARTAAAVPAFTSVFDSYQPYAEEKTANWRQANDNTARIGGWRAYAKEATEPAPATVLAPATSPAKP